MEDDPRAPRRCRSTSRLPLRYTTAMRLLLPDADDLDPTDIYGDLPVVAGDVPTDLPAGKLDVSPSGPDTRDAPRDVGQKTFRVVASSPKDSKRLTSVPGPAEYPPGEFHFHHEVRWDRRGTIENTAPAA